MRRTLIVFSCAGLAACGVQQAKDAVVDEEADSSSDALSATASLGKALFRDTSLSEPAGQACATCHDSRFAFTDPRLGPTSEGAVSGRFGVRNTPTIVYSSYTPPLKSATDEAGYSGGFFLDGRAPTLEAQAGGPLLNPLEMNNASKAAVVAKVAAGPYAARFKKAYGASIFNDAEAAFAALTSALADYERTGMPKRFTSKYDAYLAGRVRLSASEARGLVLFEDPKRGNCASCHLDKPAADGTPPLFTDFGYDNLGIPKNPDNGFYTVDSTFNPKGRDYVDHGLSGAIINPREDGKFKAPTLRNIALTSPYGHNGAFPDLWSIVEFYNTRDVREWGWDAPEVSFDLNTKDMGNLQLSDQEVDDLVAFLGTLTDGYSR